MEVISIVNRKGGIGKTTCSVNIGRELAYQGYKTLLLDLDSQGDLTKIFEQGEVDYDIFDLLNGEGKLEEVIEQVTNNLYLIKGSEDIIHWRGEEGEDRLKVILDNQQVEFDYVLIDHPPNLNESALTGLVASSKILLILEPEIFAISNIDSFLADIEQIKELMNPDLEILGMIINRENRMRNLTKKVVQDLQAGYGDLLFSERISNDTSIPTSSYKRLSLRDLFEEEGYYTRSLSEFKAITKELIERIG